MCKAFALCIKRWGCVARSTQIRKTLSSTVVTMTADNDKVLLKIRETIDSRRCWLADSITPNVIYWWSLLDWISDFFQKHSGSVWIKENDIGVVSLKSLINIGIWKIIKDPSKVWICKPLKILSKFICTFTQSSLWFKMTQIAKPSKSHDDDFDNSAKNYMLILSFICCSRLCKNSYTVNGMCRNLTQATRYIYPCLV